jgi:hypothetical protein
MEYMQRFEDTRCHVWDDMEEIKMKNEVVNESR